MGEMKVRLNGWTKEAVTDVTNHAEKLVKKLGGTIKITNRLNCDKCGAKSEPINLKDYPKNIPEGWKNDGKKDYCNKCKE